MQRPAIATVLGLALLSGCAGGAPEGAEDSVALVRGTQTKDLSSLDNCLEKAGFSTSPDEVEERSVSNGDPAHLVTFTSGDDDIQFVVVPEEHFVFLHGEADAAALERIGCAIDGAPLPEGSLS